MADEFLSQSLLTGLATLAGGIAQQHYQNKQKKRSDRRVREAVGRYENELRKTRMETRDKNYKSYLKRRKEHGKRNPFIKNKRGSMGLTSFGMEEENTRSTRYGG